MVGWTVKFITDELLSHSVTALVVLLMVYLPGKARKFILRSKIEKAYFMLRNVCEPDTLNPQQPGNPVYMKAAARDYINPLRKSLSKAGLEPPDKCTVGDGSLQEWFEYFGRLRME